jgi:hypothetical protein
MNRRVTLVGVQSTQGTRRQALTSYAVWAPLAGDGATEERVNMNVNTVVDSAIPVCGLRASGFGPNNVGGGRGDLLETRPFSLGLDVASENGYAR